MKILLILFAFISFSVHGQDFSFHFYGETNGTPGKDTIPVGDAPIPEFHQSPQGPYKVQINPEGTKKYSTSWLKALSNNDNIVLIEKDQDVILKFKTGSESAQQFVKFKQNEKGDSVIISKIIFPTDSNTLLMLEKLKSLGTVSDEN